jgi:site-specific DNA recombinase
MMRKQHCAIYTRQSSMPSHRETSCNAQFDRCVKFISSMKLIGREWVGARYDDAGYGDATLDRPALQELVQSVTSGRVDIVVVEYLDRLSRSVVDVLTLMESFCDHARDQTR